VVLAVAVVLAGYALGRRLLVAPPPTAAPAPSAAANVVNLTAADTPTASGGSGADATAVVTSGALAPDFRLSTPSGEAVALADYRGRPVLLNFFATWCAPCRGEMPFLEQAYVRHQAQDLVVLAVSLEEEPAVVPPFVTDLGLTFPVVLDGDGAVANQYGISILPTSFLIDADGQLVHRRNGFYTSESQLEQDLAAILPPEVWPSGG